MAWTRKLPSGKWQGSYRDTYGKTRTAGTFRRKGDAQDAGDEEERKIRRGEWTDPELRRTLVADYAEQWLAGKKRRKPKTFASYESTLRLYVLPYFGKMQLRAISREDVQAFVWHLETTGKGPATVHKAFRTLRAVLKDAELNQRIIKSPVFSIVLPEVGTRDRSALAPPQIEALANAIDPRYRALVLVGAYTGLRWAECAGLAQEDLDLVNGFAIIRRTLSEVSGTLHVTDTKNHRVRDVPLPRFLCRELDDHIARYSRSEGFTFPNPDPKGEPFHAVFLAPEGGPLRHNVYGRYYKPALERAGLASSWRFHDLRHSAASVAGSKTYAGESAKTVQTLLGHSSQQVTTEIYSHLFSDDLDRLKESLDRIHEDASKNPAAHMLHAADSTVTALTPRRGKKAV